ncbi:GPGG-motif small membrane protein [Actinomadura fibrosa]|uniref:GPGG-motif small membrane protein n=1 Tax=Actinomadura fibrosa TaxID=111802 RepID=A0ABW2XUD3_9ACTN|nr:GPGG-motif small membrane protein [Actinomadura fibrosa]
MVTILSIIAAILVIAGIYVILARRDLIWGIVLIVVGLLVGPGGISIFH